MEYSIPAWVEILLLDNEDEGSEDDQYYHWMHYSNSNRASPRVAIMTDTSRYKSVAIKKDSYKKLKGMADQDYRSVAGFIEYLIDKELEERRNAK